MDNKNIEITYRNARIRFDIATEEWIAYMNTTKFYDIGTDEFNRHKSLQKLKDSIDRFNKKAFKNIPILMFDNEGNMKNAEIISFTEKPGECWIMKDEDRRELIKTMDDGIGDNFSRLKKIYACENINNEPIILEINSLREEMDRLESNLRKKKAEINRLIYNLQPFDISGLAISPDEDIII